mgnify:CR=1 FL=1
MIVFDVMNRQKPMRIDIAARAVYTLREELLYSRGERWAALANAGATEADTAKGMKFNDSTNLVAAV